MNILSISSDRNVFEQGSAVRSRLLEYGRLVHELHVIVFAKSSLKLHNESFPPNIFLYPTNAIIRLGYIFSAIGIAFKLKRRGINIDVVTAQDPFESGLAAFFVARIFGAKLHFQIHTDFMSPYFARMSLLNDVRVVLARMLLPRANAVRVVSDRIRRSITAFISPNTPIKVLPIFVDAERIKRAPVSVDLKKKYPQFDTRLLIAARLEREKNIPLALEAMKAIVAKYPRAGLLIAGSGSEEMHLRALVARLGLEHNVFFEGNIDDLSSFYKTADLFLISSNYEGYGMTAVEAISAGCPVIMTDVGCAGDMIRNGENGLVVPVGNKEAFTDAVLRVMAGDVKLDVKPPKLPTKEEYLAAYRASWEDALER